MMVELTLRKDECAHSSCPIFRCSMEMPKNCVWTDFQTMLCILSFNNNYSFNNCYNNNHYVTKPVLELEYKDEYNTTHIRV